jgi:hypothetical protein
MTTRAETAKAVKKLLREIKAAKQAADAYNGPTPEDYFRGDAHFDYTDPDTGEYKHDFAKCPYHRLRNLERAYRWITDPLNKGQRMPVRFGGDPDFDPASRAPTESAKAAIADLEKKKEQERRLLKRFLKETEPSEATMHLWEAMWLDEERRAKP